MGTSYLTQSQKSSIVDQFYNIHATFGRPIAIFKTATQTVIQSNPDNNFLFDGAPFNSTTEVVQQSGIFIARILYGSRDAAAPFNTIQRDNASDQINLRLDQGEVRIKLDPTGASYLAGAQRVTFDGKIFEVITPKRPIGPFFGNTGQVVGSGPIAPFESFYLKELN